MRSLAHEPFDPELEAELRATLRRKAGDLDPSLPTWGDLIRDSEAVVVSLRTGRPLPDGRIRGRRRAWIRPFLAAAASLALAMAAGIAIGRGSSPEGDPTDQADDGTGDAQEAEQALEAAESELEPDLVSPGQPAFRASEPDILYPFGADEAVLRTEVREADETSARQSELAGLMQPEGVARRYLLDTMAIVEPDTTLDPPATYELWTDPPLPESFMFQPDRDGDTVEVASVWWSLRDPARTTETNQPAVVTQGQVFLRNLADPSRANRVDAWVVSGAATQGIALVDTERVANEMTFTVNTNFLDLDVTDPSSLSLDVQVNGALVSPQDVFGGVQQGQGSAPYRVAVPAAETATILVRYLSHGEPVSVVAVAFPPARGRTVGPTVPSEIPSTTTIP